jgi:hypothetical protein
MMPQDDGMVYSNVKIHNRLCVVQICYWLEWHGRLCHNGYASGYGFAQKPIFQHQIVGYADSCVARDLALDA